MEPNGEHVHLVIVSGLLATERKLAHDSNQVKNVSTYIPHFRVWVEDVVLVEFQSGHVAFRRIMSGHRVVQRYGRAR